MGKIHLFDGSRPHLQDEILRRVAAGELVVEICADAGMPRAGTVSGWACETDPEGFGARLREARRVGDWMRRFRFDPAVAETYLAGLRAGRTMHEMRRDPATPSMVRLRYWRATQAEFNVEIGRLSRERRAWAGVRRTAGAAERVAWTPALGDLALRLAGLGHSLPEMRGVDGRLPNARGLRRWRREQPTFSEELAVNLRFGRLARGKARRWAAVRKLCAGIAKGGTVSSLAGKRGLPVAQALYAWIARDAAFARAVHEAYRQRDIAREEQGLAAAKAAVAAADPDAALRALQPLFRRDRAARAWPGKRWLPGGKGVEGSHWGRRGRGT